MFNMCTSNVTCVSLLESGIEETGVILKSTLCLSEER